MNPKITLMALATVLLSINGGTSHGIDASSIADQYKLVGIISSNTSKKHGIVVIRDKESKRTYTVRSGERIPQSDNVRVFKIGRRSITLTARGSTMVLSYGGSEVQTSPQKAESRLVNLTDLENFYRERSADEEEADVNRWPKVDLERTQEWVDDDSLETTSANRNSSDDDGSQTNVKPESADQEEFSEQDREDQETTSIKRKNEGERNRDFMTYEEYRQIYSKQLNQQKKRKKILH